MTITPKMLVDLAYFFANTGRQKLEEHGIIQPGKAGDNKWKQFNNDFDIFILKSSDEQLAALTDLINGYVGFFELATNEKTHPRFIAGYASGLKDGQSEHTSAPIAEIVPPHSPASAAIYGRDVLIMRDLRHIPIGAKLYLAPPAAADCAPKTPEIPK